MGILFEKMRGLFVREKAWRIFVVLQLSGLAGLFILDVANTSWSILPRPARYSGIVWDLFDSSHYTRHSTNWYALAFIFGPFIATKAFDWVYSSGSLAVDHTAREQKIAQEMKASMIECTASIKQRWLTYNETLKFKSDVPLESVIEAFSLPVKGFVEMHYPLLLAGGGQIFWMMIFTAILDSGTHSKDSVNQAIEILAEKYTI